MKHSNFIPFRIALFSISLFVLIILSSSKLYSQTFDRVEGIYQAYMNSGPVKVEGMNMYYLLNKNGLVFLAFGSSSSRAFSDVNNGISSGRIMGGNFTLNGNSITMRLKSESPSNTYWTYTPNTANISSNEGGILLKFIESLDNPKPSGTMTSRVIRIGNLEVAQFDFQSKMNWTDAKNSCIMLGEGWRLPTKEELNIIYMNISKIGDVSEDGYWTSTENGSDKAWRQYLTTGGQYTDVKYGSGYVRAVKSF
jgi:hypothetical protein